MVLLLYAGVVVVVVVVEVTWDVDNLELIVFPDVGTSRGAVA